MDLKKIKIGLKNLGNPWGECSVTYSYKPDKIYSVVMQAKNEIQRNDWKEMFESCVTNNREIATLFKYLTHLIFENTYLGTLDPGEIEIEISNEDFVLEAFYSGTISILEIKPFAPSPHLFGVKRIKKEK